MKHELIHIPDYLLVVDDSGTRIAHLPLNYSPILEGVDLLPPLEQEDDVDKLAEEYGENIGNKNGTAAFDYKRGYNKAKEKYKFTEEDMRKIFIHGKQLGLTIAGNIRNGSDQPNKEEWFNESIQSLSQPKMPVGFECEMVTMNKGYTDEKDYPYQQCEINKTTTNSQGQTQWVGKYIFT
jgi:hypothetical protein